MCISHLVVRRFNKDHKWCLNKEKLGTRQRAKKVVFARVQPLYGAGRKQSSGTGLDSLGLVNFAIELVNSVLNLPDGQVKNFRRIKITEIL